MDMRVKIAGVEWNNPVTVASGTFGSGEEYSEFVDLNRLGAVTTKGVAAFGFCPNAIPPSLTFGQEILISSISTSSFARRSTTSQ